MKNRGFMLIEVLAASAFVIIALITLFTQFTSIKNNYDKSFTYNLAQELHKTANIVTYIEEYSDFYNDIKQTVDTNGYYIFYDNSQCNGDYNTIYCNSLLSKLEVGQVIITSADLDLFKTKVDSLDISNTFKDFIEVVKYEDAGNYKILVEYTDEMYADLRF